MVVVVDSGCDVVDFVSGSEVKLVVRLTPELVVLDSQNVLIVTQYDCTPSISSKMCSNIYYNM